jgi:hypothetical protein
MGKSERGGAGRSFVVLLVVLVILGLAGAVVYLLSDINHRRYRLAVHEGTLVVERGRMAPAGFKRFEPEVADLQAGYAPIPVPPGISVGRTEIFEDRADIDRALFSMLASWARERLTSTKPGDFELAAGYVSRCESLPGLSEEQRIELRTLRADLAFRSGRRILGDIVTQLEKARTDFQTAKELGTSRPRDVDQWIADVERRMRDYRESYGKGGEAREPTGEPASPEAQSPLPTEEPPAAGDSESPKWRL